MSEFDYFAIVVAIPLGLALVEIAQGVSVTLRRHRDVAVGLLTPLLAVVLLTLLIDAWLQLWAAQQSVEINRLYLTMGLFAASVFYVAASFIFPDQIEAGADLDDWFMQYRKYSLGGTFLLVFALRLAQGYGIPQLDQDSIVGTAAYLVGWGLRPGLILVAIFAKRRWIIVSALSALIVMPIFVAMS
ncbi:hypothetical protein ACI5KX_09310 [Erythrobacter sp. GH1-10]|uniref:hypothetical protein n=1 Tax=Erythrobacter sp. GH1-10 TaxID=3349334 RepID=UPI003877A320